MHANDQRAKFALAVLHKTLQHFDSGGTVLGGPMVTTQNTASNPNTGIGGTIGGALGLNNNFQAGSADIQAGTNAAQLNNSYGANQAALLQQQELASNLVPGAGQAALSQQDLLRQLELQSHGQGPDPAQAALNQNTAVNTANQAALMAGQRGASANVGLMARQVANQGAANQQQMVGQGATLQAQQQLAAQQELAKQQAQLVGQGTNALAGVTNAQQGEQGILQNANTAFNNAGVQMQSNMNTTNAQTAAGNQGMAGKIIGGVGQAAGSVLGAIGLAEGGEVPPAQPNWYEKLAAQGYLGDKAKVAATQGNPVWKSSQGKQNYADGGMVPGGPISHAGRWLNAPPTKMAKGGTVMEAAYRRMNCGGSVNMKSGGNVNGKAPVKGDSYKNDNVPAMLSPGEVVIPRHVMQSKNPAEAAAKFVAAILAKKQGLRKAS